jgi:hypothetical protein
MLAAQSGRPRADATRRTGARRLTASHWPGTRCCWCTPCSRVVRWATMHASGRHRAALLHATPRTHFGTACRRAPIPGRIEAYTRTRSPGAFTDVLDGWVRTVSWPQVALPPFWGVGRRRPPLWPDARGAEPRSAASREFRRLANTIRSTLRIRATFADGRGRISAAAFRVGRERQRPKSVH